MVHRYETMISGRLLSIETGKLAGQANGAVQVRYGDTIVLAAATAAREPRPDADFFPLTVDYEERHYAAGKIPGGFFKREGRPSEQAILTCRLTDRPIRPMFPKGFRNEVQIIVDVLSADQENEPDILSVIGASAALTVSDIPFDGPVAAVKVGRIGGQLILNPTATQLAQSDLNLTVAGSEDAIVMVEAGAQELSEADFVAAIRFGHEGLQEIVRLQKRMRDAIGKPKFAFSPAPVNEAAISAVRDSGAGRIEQIMGIVDKTPREEALRALKSELATQFASTYTDKEISSGIDQVEKEVVRRNILEKGIRPDGRNFTTIRPISCEVGLLPRTHGSGLFTRGQTQVLSIVTLGSVGENQIIDGLGAAETKRFIHHYNMPPFSVGEVRRLGTGRREIGHGALAERAVGAVVPPVEDFPYTVRIVSEALSSNGSTSMGSVCGSILALMDAGVPIKAPVAGVAMGLMTDDKGNYAVLTDIQGAEDHLGDMDFKVAGTERGITALQMDIKIKGLSDKILQEALAQAREGRLFILGKMLSVISESRPEMSRFAPRVLKTKINPEKIGALIGPGGKVIRGLQAEFSVKIDVQEDGNVFVSGSDPEGAKSALVAVERLGKDVEIGQDYLGKVTRITNFGAFVEILPGKEGLVRIGDLAEYQVNSPEDVVSIGDEIMVRVIEIDFQGRVNLSRRAVFEGTMTSVDQQPARRAEGERFGDRGGAPMGERRPYDRPRPYGGGGGGSRPPYGDRGPRPGGPSGPPRGPRPPRPGFDR
jgi:polyribonucleotide nucleotidyltransferase